jgi:hypothetical protein
MGFLQRWLKPAPKPLAPAVREEIAKSVRTRWELDQKVNHLNKLADDALKSRTHRSV